MQVATTGEPRTILVAVGQGWGVGIGGSLIWFDSFRGLCGLSSWYGETGGHKGYWIYMLSAGEIIFSPPPPRVSEIRDEDGDAFSPVIGIPPLPSPHQRAQFWPGFRSRWAAPLRLST